MRQQSCSADVSVGIPNKKITYASFRLSEKFSRHCLQELPEIDHTEEGDVSLFEDIDKPDITDASQVKVTMGRQIHQVSRCGEFCTAFRLGCTSESFNHHTPTIALRVRVGFSCANMELTT